MTMMDTACVQVNDGNVRGAVSVRGLQRSASYRTRSCVNGQSRDATDVRKTLLDDDGDARAVIDDVDELMAVVDFLGAPLALPSAPPKPGHLGLDAQ